MSENSSRDFDPKLSWNSSKDDIINDFYRPALVNCKLYQRLSGYFSSTTFSTIANEILDFIHSNGRIQLITSPKFTTKDKELLEHSVTKNMKILEDGFLEELRNDADCLKLEFFKLVGYMLSNIINDRPQLEIKIAIPKGGGGIFHQKIGIMHYHNDERIAFAGSVNETWKGWNENIENLTVFRSWVVDDTNNQGIIDNQRNFNDLWSNVDQKIEVFDLPSAIKQRLLEISPKSDEELKSTMEKIRQLVSKTQKHDTSPSSESAISLKSHQLDALSKWFENDCKGLLQMATGSGKTFTAFGGINRLQKEHHRTLTIIACPQKHLVEQWRDASISWNDHVSESDKILLDFQATCNSDYVGWRKELENKMYDLGSPQLSSNTYVQNHMIIFTTHDTLETPDFLEKILNAPHIKKILVVDEVHNITEKRSQKVLLDDFDFRLGLSATPMRHLDEDGTQILLDYFQGIVYTLSIEDAIKRDILCPYEYFPYYVELTSDEADKYSSLTAQIAQLEQKKKMDTYNPTLEQFNPSQKRSDLVSNAENKDRKLGEILRYDLDDYLDHTLIYCTNNPSPLDSKRPKQLERVKNILFEHGIESDSVTWEDVTKERLAILENLRINHLDCVTAVKCLDEGVDVPDVHTGIFMASSGNPKQFVQRRGRILRKSDITGKKSATIYDILVIPKIVETSDSEYSLAQRKLAARELLRHKEFASIALNRDDAIEDIRHVATSFKINLDDLDYEYIKNMD